MNIVLSKDIISFLPFSKGKDGVSVTVTALILEAFPFIYLSLCTG